VPLRVLSYNILNGGRERLPHIANVIRGSQPDAVALLEANSRPNAQWLARELDMHLTFGKANSEFHIAWLSCVAPRQAKNWCLPVLAKTLLEIELTWEQVPLRLFATHLRAGREREHDLYRAEEMRAILDVLRASSETPHLLVGDLNTISPADPTGTPPAAAEVEDRRPGTSLLMRAVIPLLLEAGYVDCYRMQHPVEPGYTYQPPEPWLRLDYISPRPNSLAGCRYAMSW
jgi:exodeoxyribonuclease III